MKRTALLVLLILLLLALTACKTGENDQPPLTSGEVTVTSGSAIPTSVPPSIRGRITSISMMVDGAIVLIEGDNTDQPDISYNSAIVRLDAKTTIATESGAVLDALSLAAGDTVEMWFGSTVLETSPVQSYAQAVKVITGGELTANSWGVVNMPRMTVNNGGTSSLAAAYAVSWDEMTQRTAPIADVLSANYGARLAVRGGSSLQLAFNMPPDSYTVAYRTSDADASASTLVEVVDSQISIPKDAQGTLIYTVTAGWEENSVSYVFSVRIF